MNLQIFATVTVDEFAPGAKSVFTFTIPDHKSGKVCMKLISLHPVILSADKWTQKLNCSCDLMSCEFSMHSLSFCTSKTSAVLVAALG